MRFRTILTIGLLLGVGLALTACGRGALLSQVSFSAEEITPNADGETDALQITYDLSRSAELSIYFEDRDGERYYFRDHVYHGPSIEKPYQVLFSGVVDGYLLPGETFEGFTVEERVLQNGRYTWAVEATHRGSPSDSPAPSP